MKKTLPIYLAGNIRKGKEEDHLEVWTEEHQQLLQRLLPHVTLNFLDPACRTDDLSDQVSVFGRDLYQVSSSKLVLVDARSKRGLGVGAEMMFAKVHRIPVAVWLPEESHYKRNRIELLGKEVADWIHPFIFNLSDYVAPTLEDAARWIKENLLLGKVVVKGLECAQEAISHYCTTQTEISLS
ncbi:MAG: hypothetical protein LLG04_00070 [Parachlamydia sp.]|nr:hypothetical protein [Parachlamydia sp.]